jgi:hypothetical protein
MNIVFNPPPVSVSDSLNITGSTITIPIFGSFVLVSSRSKKSASIYGFEKSRVVREVSLRSVASKLPNKPIGTREYIAYLGYLHVATQVQLALLFDDFSLFLNDYLKALTDTSDWKPTFLPNTHNILYLSLLELKRNSPKGLWESWEMYFISCFYTLPR